MPDLSSASVPPLRARVHGRLSPSECHRLTVDDLRFRTLKPEDFEEMVALHTEWFPVTYDEAFYRKSTGGDNISLVATYAASEAPGPSSAGVAGLNIEEGNTLGPEEDLLGIITVSTSCEHHAEDITTVLGADCSTICQKKCGNTPLMVADRENGCARGALAYILTLGVVEGFRRKGLARELLKKSIAHVDANYPEVQAVYLHVVTYNTPAIELYESLKFVRIGFFSSFYRLHGGLYDSYLYARYLHGSHAPWRWRFKQWLGSATSWKEWVVSTWSSLWRSGHDPSSRSIDDSAVDMERP